MFPQDLPLGWNPLLEDSFYKLSNTNRNGKYNNSTAYVSGPIFFHPPHRLNIEPGTQVFVSASDILSEAASDPNSGYDPLPFATA